MKHLDGNTARYQQSLTQLFDVIKKSFILNIVQKYSSLVNLNRIGKKGRSDYLEFKRKTIFLQFKFEN